MIDCVSDIENAVKMPANTSIQPPARKRLFAVNPAEAAMAEGAPVRVEASSPLRLDAPTKAAAQSRATVEPPAEDFEKAKKILDELYEKVKASWPGFIARNGQRQMMDEALAALMCAKRQDSDETQGENIARVEAGTGTGKTVAYCLAAIAASRVTGKKVVISTATVALQEQLVERDLPRLSEVLGGIEFEILKGRNRYVCKSKLDGAMDADLGSYLFDDEEGSDDAAPAPEAIIKELGDLYTTAKWNGELDTLPIKVESRDWRKIQADGSTCTSTKCGNYKDCAFYKARGQAKTKSLVVGNHALVLSNLARDSKLLTPVEHLFIFDEAHHLPEIAADQFAAKTRLSSTDKVLSRMKTVLVKAIREGSSQLRQQQEAIVGLVGASAESIRGIKATLDTPVLFPVGETQYRFADGVVPEEILDLFQNSAKELEGVVSAVRLVQADLKTAMDELSPSQRQSILKLDGELSLGLELVREAAKVMNYMTRHGDVPLVKWIDRIPFKSSSDIQISASPLTPASGLYSGLWSKVAAAVCTSATITACGDFDYFDRLSGLNRMPNRRGAVVDSPFDYQRQGLLRVAAFQSNPKSPAFTDEMARSLPGLLEGVDGGQLVLFTSKKQMQACFDALPAKLKALVQVQGSGSRGDMLREHARRVKSGQSSILFGLQSLGEGIDLPGDLCNHVVIDKLPFTPPTSPSEAALSEWLQAQGRDSFMEIAVPKASVKLAQWVGRGIRTVNDKAIITVCDTRLATTRYGRSLVAGLPNFPFLDMSQQDGRKKAEVTASNSAPPVKRHFRPRATA